MICERLSQNKIKNIKFLQNLKSVKIIEFNYVIESAISENVNDFIIIILYYHIFNL